MKYKILLTGNNKTIIDDLFTKSSDSFEYQSTSARYEDIACHMKYFQPDGFLYCVNHELPESFRRMAELKQSPEAGKTSFFVIGTRAECSTYTQMAPGVVDLVLEKPMTLSAMEEKILIYFSNPDTPPTPSDGSAVSVSIPMPAKQQQTVDGMVQELNQSQADSTVQTAAAQPTGRQPAVNPAQTAKKPQVTGQTQAPGTPPSAAGQMQVPNTPQPSSQAQPASQPTVTKSAQTATPTAKAKPSPAPAKQDTSADGTDALLQALTNEIGEAARLLEAVEDMDLNPDAITDDVPSERKHILVVDDDSRMLKIIKRHLSDKYDVATALNGRIALKFLENKKTDLILLDYEMPLESGPAILKKLRDNPATRNIPVIFLTGISERDKIEKALALKPQGYLLKPIDHIKLLATISKFVD